MTESRTAPSLRESILVQSQARQLHKDVQVLMATGVASGRPSEAIAWLFQAFADIAKRAEGILPGTQVPHLEAPQDIADVYMALGQIVASLSAFLDEAATQRQGPIGFRQPREGLDKQE
jgi:hypothetical protein